MSDEDKKYSFTGNRNAPEPGLGNPARAEVSEVLSEHFAWLSRMCLFSVRDPNVAEDCLQEVLTEVARSYPTFAGGSQVKTWIYTVAKRTIYRFIKKTWRYRSWQVLGREHDAAEDEIAVEPDEPLFDRSELEAAIAKLSDRQRQAVLLHYVEDLSVEQGAERMGCSISSFKTHLLRARERLRELVQSSEQSGAASSVLTDQRTDIET